MKTTKTNDERVGLSLNPKYKIQLILRHMHKFVNWTLHPLHMRKYF
jgi:hypothetical protein